MAKQEDPQFEGLPPGVPPELVQAALEMLKDFDIENNPDLLVEFVNEFENAGAAAQYNTAEELAEDEAIRIRLRKKWKKRLKKKLRWPIIKAMRAFALTNAAVLVTNMNESARLALAKVLAEQAFRLANVPETRRAVERELIDQMLENMGDRLAALDSNRAKKYIRLKEELIAQGLSSGEADEALQRTWEKMVRSRAQTIARTESRRAMESATRASAQDLGATMKRSKSVGDDRVSTICRSCEAQQWIPIDEVFVSGEPAPPHHPNCRCTVGYKSDLSVEEIGERLATRN